LRASSLLLKFESVSPLHHGGEALFSSISPWKTIHAHQPYYFFALGANGSIYIILFHVILFALKADVSILDTFAKTPKHIGCKCG